MERRGYVLDTGRLVELFLLRWEETTKLDCWRREIHQHALRTTEDAHIFERFLAENSGRLVTTPGVLAEIERWFKQCGQACKQVQYGLRRSVWDDLCDTFRRFSVEEAAVSVHEMDRAVLHDLGVVDAGLLVAAERRLADFDHCVLVINDGPLLARTLEVAGKRTLHLSAEYAADVLGALRRS